MFPEITPRAPFYGAGAHAGSAMGNLASSGTQRGTQDHPGLYPVPYSVLDSLYKLAQLLPPGGCQSHSRTREGGDKKLE